LIANILTNEYEVRVNEHGQTAFDGIGSLAMSSVRKSRRTAQKIVEGELAERVARRTQFQQERLQVDSYNIIIVQTAEKETLKGGLRRWADGRNWCPAAIYMVLFYNHY
jgi:hypothetical protein